MKKAFELRVTLEHTNPKVWRKLLVPDSFSFYELHHSIQLAFGWQNYHLYSFITKTERIGNPELMDDFDALNDKLVLLNQVFTNLKDKIRYEYDFGDGWMHSIVLEKVSAFDVDVYYPVCVDGKMACPPEDCGGIPGFENLIEVMKDKKHPEYGEFVEWLGKPFKADVFDLVKANKELRKMKKYIAEYESES